MTRQVADYLLECDYEADIAYYMPYRIDPELSVPLWRLLGKRPRIRESTDFNAVKSYEVGVCIPELEWARYTTRSTWRRIIEKYDYHIVVSGSILPALPVVLERRPCLAWIATPHLQDKMSNIDAYPWYRRLIFWTFDLPISVFLEKFLLKKTDVLALSSYTKKAIQKISAKTDIKRMPMPIDTRIFYPPPNAKAISWKIGFCGRLDDARKNVRMLIDAVKTCKEKGYYTKLHLVGSDKRLHEYEEYAERVGAKERVEIKKPVPREELGEFYRSLDIFAVPSRQEGLGIAGLEAMACGCPVVSTRCGGPEEYIKNGINGFLVDLSAEEIAHAIIGLLSNEELYRKMRRAASQTISSNYSHEHAKRIFFSAFDRTFNEVNAR